MIVAVFAVLTVNVGLEGWFSQRVHQVIGSSLAAAEAYQEEQRRDITTDAQALSRFLDQSRSRSYYINDAELRQVLTQGQLQIQRGLREAYVIDGTGRIRARGERSYEFDFDSSTRINDKLIYVVNFKQKKNITTPLYYGKLYIEAETKALTNAVYSLNVSNRTLSSQMYVRKKPRKVDVYPTQATYRVNYRIKDGKWHYAYSNISLTFKVNWKGKLFNNTYTLSSEMAITDWEIRDTKIADVRSQLLRPSTILTEKASGFSDPRFWGDYNIIEPEK